MRQHKELAAGRWKKLSFCEQMANIGSEVERALAQHSSVQEVAIIGLPSDKWGEEVTAIVVIRPGCKLDADELIGFGREHLATYKVPNRVVFIPYEEMPINFSGKILKRELRARFATAS